MHSGGSSEKFNSMSLSLYFIYAYIFVVCYICCGTINIINILKIHVNLLLITHCALITWKIYWKREKGHAYHFVCTTVKSL